jgi:hypothetical protein
VVVIRVVLKLACTAPHSCKRPIRRGNIIRVLTNQMAEWGIFSGPRPIRRPSGEYSQGLDQSDGRVGHIVRALTNQTAKWGIFSGPPPIRWLNGAYSQGLDQTDGRVGNILRASTNYTAVWRLFSAPQLITWPSGKYPQGRERFAVCSLPDHEIVPLNTPK